MVNVMVHYDALYWEQQSKQRLNCHFDPKTTLTHPSKSLHTPITFLPSTNRNSTTTPHQPESSQTMLCTLKPYDNILGLDGKLKPEELECWHKNKLCIVCSTGNHQASECPATKQGCATELQVEEESENVPREEIESKKSEN